MTNTDTFYVKFWGVRGSIPCPGMTHRLYGGNTSCLEIKAGNQTLIFDAGTGICQLGHTLLKDNPLSLNLFFSHFHYDHVWGWPFFEPALDNKGDIRIYGGSLGKKLTTQKIMTKLIANEENLVNQSSLRAKLYFSDFVPGDTIRLDQGVSILTTELNHPDRAVGYRIEYRGKSICYLTDHEHGNMKIYSQLVEFIYNSDIVIYDATYTDEEYLEHIGWGHSTWQEGVRICDDANVKTYVAFHHDPNHDDIFMDNIFRDLKKMRPGSYVAREGMVLKP